MPDMLLFVTSSPLLALANLAMNAYQHYNLYYYYYSDKISPQTRTFSVAVHVTLMQILTILTMLQFAYRKAKWHRLRGYAACAVFVLNIPFALHLAYMMLQSRHWWHSFVQVTSLLVSGTQMVRVINVAQLSSMKTIHEAEARKLASVINGASGARLLGNMYTYGFGVNEESSYTLGLSTMFLMFLVPRIFDLLCNEWPRSSIKQHQR